MGSRNREEFETAAQQDREIRKAVDLLYELSADEQVRAMYDQRQKAWMDFNTLREDYYQIGTEKGIQIGMERGRESGIKIGTERVIELLQSGKTLEEVKQILGMQP